MNFCLRNKSSAVNNLFAPRAVFGSVQMTLYTGVREHDPTILLHPAQQQCCCPLYVWNINIAVWELAGFSVLKCNTRPWVLYLRHRR